MQHSLQWLALSACAHRTVAVGQHDGYSIVLLPKISSTHPEQPFEDTNLDLNSEPATEAKEKGQPASDKHFGGLRKYMCFEFADSVTEH